MKPVAIFRHAAIEGPGYFATVLGRHDIPWQLIAVDRGECIPAGADGFAGLAFMGGPMSVNDGLAWIADALHLIRDAAAHEVPLLGHCLGGQLVAKALGATVASNAVKEIGWGEVQVAAHPVAWHWFGTDDAPIPCFHWHGETFSIPAGATRVLSGEHCANQGFALGRHLAMQCHIEMTAEMVEAWCGVGAAEIAAAGGGAAVQQADAIRQAAHDWLPRLRRVADTVYERWIRGLRL